MYTIYGKCKRHLWRICLSSCTAIFSKYFTKTSLQIDLYLHMSMQMSPNRLPVIRLPFDIKIKFFSLNTIIVCCKYIEILPLKHWRRIHLFESDIGDKLWLNGWSYPYRLYIGGINKVSGLKFKHQT